MSTPGHDNAVVVVGDVGEVVTDEHGTVIGVILMVDAGEPCEVPIMLPSDLPDVSVGDRLWVRGRLAWEPLSNRRGSLHFVQAQWIDPVRRARGT
jgi:hypothetical protein